MSSYFFYADGPMDKIHLGPGWDFDLSFSFEPTWGANYGINLFSPYKTGVSALFADKNTPLIQDYSEVSINGETESTLMYYLVKNPEFLITVKNIYNNYILPNYIKIFQYIDAQADTIQSAAQKNNDYWNFQDFQESIKNLKTWLHNRLDYLEIYYGNKNSIINLNIREL